MTTTASLRQFLSEQLPGYMVPSAIMLVDALPLTPNRKVDLAALPDPPDEAYEAASVTGEAAPAGEREEAVAAIWREVLARDEVGADDHFFRIGGNSLSVMQVLAQLRKRHNARITVQEFLDRPTIRALARQLAVASDA